MSFLFLGKGDFYAKNKVSKYYFYRSDGICHGLLHDCLYHLAEIRCIELLRFYLAVKEMWLEYLVVFCLIFFVITNIANKLAFRIIHAGSLPPIFTILAIQCFTVCQIVPVITLFATLVHNGITQNWFCQWLQLAVICFPMALCTQIFFAGPFVRFIFRKIFKTR